MIPTANYQNIPKNATVAVWHFFEEDYEVKEESNEVLFIGLTRGLTYHKVITSSGSDFARPRPAVGKFDFEQSIFRGKGVESNIHP